MRCSGVTGDRHVVRSLDDLLDALPFLAPPNTVGYHRARERTIARYHEMRLKTWAEVGSSIANTFRSNGVRHE